MRGFLIILQGLCLIRETAEASEMRKIPRGFYRPLYLEPSVSKKADGKTVGKKLKRGARVPVAAFQLDVYSVTRSDFQKFLITHPEWRRSQVKKLFADPSYLSDWPADLDVGSEADSQSPVRYVSWFAARAYCASQGKRLPSLAEWEFAAGSYKNIRKLPQTILNWYSRPNSFRLKKVGSTFENDFGIWDLHGLIWEWVEDFNSSLVTGESRADASLDQSAFCGSGGLNASNFEDYAAFMRFGFRASLNGSFAIASLGFRCAKTIEREYK